ncbi:hypothetical protein F383_24335 [Gossypium arboreum]|uniref:Uncharacterized protein n=1 Tax=Gossypium arboreum TaxID=29729 RepID=A0A0B0MNL5_GOSAR|nr:hypothetical protein F383_24335 [Gossypium arboreum]
MVFARKEKWKQMFLIGFLTLKLILSGITWSNLTTKNNL